MSVIVCSPLNWVRSHRLALSEHHLESFRTVPSIALSAVCVAVHDESAVAPPCPSRDTTPSEAMASASSPVMARCHPRTSETSPANGLPTAPAHLSRPMRSGPVAFHGVVHDAQPSATPSTYSRIRFAGRSYRPTRWVQVPTFGGAYEDAVMTGTLAPSAITDIDQRFWSTRYCNTNPLLVAPSCATTLRYSLVLVSRTQAETENDCD